MRPLGALISVGLKSQFPPTLLWRHIRSGPKRWQVLGLTTFVAVCLLPIMYAYILLIKTFYTALHSAGQESALIAMAVIICQMMIFILGLIYIISAFYFSNDLEILIPLPLQPNQVVFSKLIIVMFNEYISILPLVLPVFLGYGILAHAPLDYWILLFPVYLLLPVIPLALAALLAIGLMRVVNLSRKKDALIIVGSLLLIILQLLLQMRSHQEGKDTEAILRFFTDQDSLIRLIGRNFPPSVWAARSLSHGFTSEGSLQFLLLAGVSVLVFFSLIVLSEKLFYQGAIGLNEIAAKRRKLSRADMEKKISSGRHPVRAIFQREVKLMNRTPIFLLNGVLVVVLIPAIFLAGTKTRGGSNPFFAILKRLGSAHPLTMILGMAAFFLICGCLNGTASSAFSREGKHFWISKIIPVPEKRQVEAKFMHSFLVSLLGIAAAAAVMAFMFGIQMEKLLAAALLAIVGSAALTLAGLRIDLARPLLNWTNPQKAIKQNFNVFLAMIVDLSSIVLCGFLARLLAKARLSGTMIYLTLLAIATAASWIAWRNLMAYADKKYPRIEM